MVLTVIFGLGAALLWCGLFFCQRRKPIETSVLIGILVVIGLSCRLAFVFGTPTFYAPDEESHYKYVKHLVEQRAFPIQTSKLGEYTNDFEYNQPPLYYVLLTPVFWLGRNVFDSVTVAVILMRLMSVLFWGINVWLAVIWLRRLEIKDSFLRVMVLGMVCLLPTYVFVSSVVNNDNLLTTLGGGLLCLLMLRDYSWKNAIATGGLLGLALLTKQSACVFVPAIVLLACWDGWHKHVAWRKVFSRMAIVGIIAALLFVPRAVWNFQTYHSLTPEFLILKRIPWPSFIEGMASTAHNILKTFWGVSGISNNIGYPFPLLGMLLMGLGMLAQQEGFRTRDSVISSQPLIRREMVWALLATFLLNLILVLRFGYISGMGQGRHLFPVLLPVALVIAAGLRHLPIKTPTIHAVGFWVAYATTFTVYSLSRFP